MAYRARGSSISDEEDMEAEKARSDANNAKNVRNAADVAIASKNPYGVAAGTAIKGADALTGGKASEAIGKGMTAANRVSPIGRNMQNLSNKLSESGVSDGAGKIASHINASNGAGVSQDKMPNQVKTNASRPENVEGGESSNSLPSSHGNKASGSGNKSEGRESGEERTDTVAQDSEEQKGVFGSAAVRRVAIIATVSLLPFTLLIFLLIPIFFAASIFPSQFDDAIGASSTAGEKNGNIAYNTNNKDQQDFFDRVNSVKLRYQSQGKTIDAYKIAAVYYVIHKSNPGFDYNQMTDSVISDIADSMLSGNSYDENTFKSNLQSSIIPRYASSSDNYEKLAEDVLQYIADYESFSVDRENGGGIYCGSSSGSCTYDIKGYYIEGKGNVTEELSVNDLQVRLMQCGVGDGHDYGGTFGQPLEGESLVPFEKYILGVAYQEIGPDSPAEAIKAQMIAARSYILARHADMGGWRTLKQEGGKWIIQVASCTQDQVYCDPDQGCSSNDGQWGQIHSGQNHNQGFSREAMPENSPLRTYASQTAGEVLVNNKGNIIYTGYLSDEQNEFISLANSGLNYKQILLQVYNQGSRNYGAKDIKKFSCNGSGSASCGGAVGDFVNWKQFGETWSNILIGTSGRTIGQIGCLVTSISMQIARSGVSTNISDFNPGTFVEYLNSNGGFIGGDFVWASTANVAPSFVYKGSEGLLGYSKESKLNTIRNIISQPNTYAVVEVKGNTGQHWVAIDSVNGDSIKMMDPASDATDLWSQYDWTNTSEVAYYTVES